MPNWDPGDSNLCSECGVDTEVIGPPGPRHKDGCSYGFVPDTSRQVTDKEIEQMLAKMRKDNKKRRP